MTLFKQMAITMSLIIIILLSSVMIINYQSTKSNMIEALYETTVNNISTLTEKIAQASEDEAFVISTIDAEFDSGYYKLIDFKSNDGKTNYKQEDNDPIEGIPSWFIEFTDIKLKAITTDITSGWNIIGNVTVKGDIAIIYKSLYKVFINLLYLFVLFVSITLIILYTMLHFILKPLYKMQTQAEGIMENKFVIQKEIPFTTEFKDVVNGMNTMVKKVEDIFNKGADALKKNKELLYSDPTTKLFNRRYLMLKILDTIKMENKSGGGSTIMLALDGAKILNTILGHKKSDELFYELACYFNTVCEKYEHKIIARVNGTEFTLLLADCHLDDANEIAKNIHLKFLEMMKENNVTDTHVYINMGIYAYKSNAIVPELLTKLDSALNVAKADDDVGIHIFQDDSHEKVLGKEAWRVIIEKAMNTNNFNFISRSCLNAKEKALNHKVMTFTINDEENNSYMYGDFMPATISLGLVCKMYILVLENLLENKDLQKDNIPLAFRLSSEFIADENSLEELEKVFKKHTSNQNLKLIFEVHDLISIKSTSTLQRYIELFTKYKFSFAINSFTGKASDFEYLKALRPSYIKFDCKFLFDQSDFSMSAITVLTDSLGINIIATYVTCDDDIQRLNDMGIQYIQGPITDSLV